MFLGHDFAPNPLIISPICFITLHCSNVSFIVQDCIASGDCKPALGWGDTIPGKQSVRSTEAGVVLLEFAIWRCLTKLISILNERFGECNMSRPGIEPRPPCWKMSPLAKSYSKSLLIAIGNIYVITWTYMKQTWAAQECRLNSTLQVVQPWILTSAVYHYQAG